MAEDVPAEITATGLDDWYNSLNDMYKVRVKRYLKCIDTSSKQNFLVDLMVRSSEDHNYKLSVLAGQYALEQDLCDYDRFRVTEAYIDGLFGAEQYDEMKVQCCNNLDLFSSVKERFIYENGGELPKTIYCRNRLIDVLVGVDYDYEKAIESLDEFVAIGILDESELDYRKQSLKIHKMQMSFDNIFIMQPKN